MSVYPNSDLNPVLAAGNCKVSVVSGGESPRQLISISLDIKDEFTFLQSRLLSYIFRNIISGGRREVALNQDFFVAFGKTALKPDEIVVSVFIPCSSKVQSLIQG